jgi:hypothetical protein
MSSTSANLLNTVTHERATSCRNTAIKHGRNGMAVLHDAILGRPWMPELPAPI